MTEKLSLGNIASVYLCITVHLKSRDFLLLIFAAFSYVPIDPPTHHERIFLAMAVDFRTVVSGRQAIPHTHAVEATTRNSTVGATHRRLLQRPLSLRELCRPVQEESPSGFHGQDLSVDEDFRMYR